MRIINLTKGYVAIVDDDDFERVNMHSWCASNASKNNNVPRAEARINKKLVRMHRFILSAPKGSYVDHVNHNTLDNRKENLRLCTNQENCRNAQKPKSNSSGYKGVSAYSGRWRAYINIYYKQIHLGIYDYEGISSRSVQRESKGIIR
jgi:HNH endonuclease